MHKLSKRRIFAFSKRVHANKNLRLDIRTTGIYLLDRKEIMEWFLKGILENNLISMMEVMGKMFLKEMEKKVEYKKL